MNFLRELGRRLWMLLRRRQFDADLEEEVRLHLELREQDQIRKGLSPKEAHHAASRRFGNAALLTEKSHMEWGWEWLESFFQDLAYGTRAMLRSPALTIVALLSLALGIGANTAIFSLLDAVMLRSLPVKNPAQLVLLGNGRASGITDDFARTQLYSYPFYRRMQAENRVFSDTAAVFSMTNSVHGFVQGRGESEPMNVQLVSGTYFDTLGVQALEGRTLNEGDDNSEGNHPVAVISYAWWRHSLARDPNVLSRTLKLGDTTFNIVGVAPPEFFGTKVGEAPDMWVPLSMVKEVPPHFGGYKEEFSESLLIMGRLKPGVSIDAATANVNLLFREILINFAGARLDAENRQKLDRTKVPLTSMTTGLSSLRRQFSKPLRLLMAIVALVLLIACANIANLLLARSTARARELAVRQALGARRSRIIRQLITESLVLAVAGGVLGIALAAIANRLLLSMVSGGLDPIPLDVSVDTRLLLFTIAVTIATALIFGTVPAFRATRPQLTDTLKAGRGPVGASARNPLAKALVISQVALSLVLMVGAGLFLRSLVNLNNVDTGFNKENVLRLNIDSSSAGYKAEEPPAFALYQQIEERVNALPNVKAASFSAFTFNEGAWSSNVAVAGMKINKNIEVMHNVVGLRYFETMQIPLIKGRNFSPSDTSTSAPVVIISEHTAKTLFPQGDPIGNHLRLSDEPKDELTVIGVVKDVKFNNLAEELANLDYMPYTQRPWGFGDFEVRYTGDFGAVAAAVQQTLHSIDRNLPITHVTTLDEQVARSITDQRVVAQLSAFFGVLAVFLSCIGIYGVMSYVVTRRTNEIGVRMALGAPRSNMLWMVLREILMLVSIGIVIGIPATLAGDRLVSNMLFGLTPTDPATLVSATVILLIVAAVAGYLPARRASLVDPMVALRYE
ncbi:MAG TPA: ABC transporter permease [Candidatus Solibacter sp.]|nr:ABC transporter permease [Candidatus Solibacter sp.]